MAVTNIALAWLLAQKPWIVPIPGTRKLERLEENLGAAEVKLTSADLREIDNAFSKITVKGARLSEDHMKLIDRWGARRCALWVAFRSRVNRTIAGWMYKVNDQRSRRTLCAKEVDRS